MHSFRPGHARFAIPGVVALGLLVLGWHGLSGSAREAKPFAAEGAGVAVDIATATRTDVQLYLEGLGTVQAYYTATITARVDGQLQDVSFVEGQRVKRGDPLAQIDPRPYRAALDLAVAAHAKDMALLGSARNDLGRYETLAPRDLASQQTLETQRGLVAQLEAQIRADQATIDNATTQLSYTSIRAPIDGRTGIRRVDPGNIVRAADTNGIVVLTQIQPIACISTLPEDSLPAITRALSAGPVAVTAVSRDGKTELDHGTVALIDNEIDQTTGTIRVKSIFPNAQNTLWPGEFVNARVLVQTVRGALTIPAAALQRGPAGFFAYVVKSDATVEARPLQVDQEINNRAVIIGGIRDGERIVISNQFRLQAGARVRDNSVALAANGRAGARTAR